ncbi:uncharacterized protein JN550_006642 [Neoarthrinium moseri]|uniref:uncharacterized protein n=1 Tax=Neoarthrinium moseri TaxID=1658444 RepID=UPI001FDBB16D|nr:uncharacterized protein JN550_006642 [Neoarthrinium moseri]KAI1868154.1 hypothetical protein JN550_006642 [Neoarthrinium moseri]
MSSARALRGSCHCGRNQYIIRVPADASRDAQVLFNTDATQRVSSASPLSAFLRVPLTWYHSQTFPFFADETTSAIRRVYSHPAEQHTLRHFCGFCGTPISFFTEQPRSEAEYIRLTLGSLLTEDLHDLEEMGLLPSDDEDDAMDIVPTAPAASTSTQLIGRNFTHIPWFDSLLDGSRLGTAHTTRGIRESRDGRVRVEWEVTEWTGNDNDDDVDAETEASESSATGKRKRGETDQGHDATKTSAR